MWSPFRKKTVEAEPDAPVEDVAEETETPEAEDAEPEPTAAEMAADIQELLSRMAETEKPSPTERTLLQKAFDKAARTVLGNAEVATEQTLEAFIEKVPGFEDEELRGDAISRLGWIAVKYPQLADKTLPILAEARDHANIEIREAALNGIAAIGESNPDQMAKSHALLSESLESRQPDVRTKAIFGLTGMTAKHEELAADTIAALGDVLAKGDDREEKGVVQAYQGRIAAARKLGELALAFPEHKDAAIAALKPGLDDAEVFVKYRTVESLIETGKKYEDAIDGIVDAMDKAKDGQIYIVQQKLSVAMTTLKPPPEPVKTEAEIEAEQKAEAEAKRKAEEAAKKAAAEQRKKAEAEQAKKDRYENIKTLANKLPGAKL